MDGVKEFKIVAGTFQAEYGLAMGSPDGCRSARVEPTSSTATSLNISETTNSMPMTFSKTKREAQSRLSERTNLERHLAAPSRKTKRSSSYPGRLRGNSAKPGSPINNAVPESLCHPPNATAANNYGAGTMIWNGLWDPACRKASDRVRTLALIPNDPSQGSPTQPYTVTLSPYTAPFLAIVPPPNIPASLDAFGQIATTAAQIGSDHDSLAENYGQMRVDHNFLHRRLFSLAAIPLTMRFSIKPNRTTFISATWCPRETSGLRWLRITFSRLRYSIPRGFPSVVRTAARPCLNNGLTQNNGLGPELVPGFSTGVVDLAGSGGGAYAEFRIRQCRPHDVRRPEHLHSER